MVRLIGKLSIVYELPVAYGFCTWPERSGGGLHAPLLLG